MIRLGVIILILAALPALVDEDIVYGEDGEVIRADRTITKVNGVIRTKQPKLEM